MSEETVRPVIPFIKSAEVGPKATGQARMLYIDNLRVLLISLVIVGHMAITYGAPLGEWYFSDVGEVNPLFEIATTLLLGIGASFLIGLFYLIAGYFTPHPFNRKGARRFITERLLRLGVPLIVYALVINPLVTYWAAVKGGYVGNFPEYVSTHVPALSRASVGPLWFVEALLAFSIVYALVRIWSGNKTDSTGIGINSSLPSNYRIALFAFGLGLVTFVVRIWAPFGWWLEPVHQEPAHFPQYIAMFVIGIVAYRQDWITRFPAARARTWGWIALALVPVLPVLAVAAGALRGEFNPAITGGVTWLSLAYSLWEAFIGMALLIAMLAWFRDHFNYQGKILQAMSPAAYAVYVLHPVIIVPLALALSGIQLSLEIKFVLFTPLAVALCFLVGNLVRRIPGIRKIL